VPYAVVEAVYPHASDALVDGYRALIEHEKKEAK